VRIVLDTNVLVSGLLNPHGAPGRIVDLVLEGTLTLLVDDRVLAEYQDVLTRPRFGFEAADVGAVIDFIDVSAERVPSVPLRLTALDPDDTAFIEVAHAGGADALVTGNPRHFRGATALGVTVVSPAAFMERWGADTGDRS
jgi:uncharacterized protein